MKNWVDQKSGFTLVEVLVSVGIMLVFLPFAANTLTNSQLLSSYSKHRIQAAFVAQQIIEYQRQQPLSFFVPYLIDPNTIPAPITPPITTPISEWVMLDTKGNYINTNCTSPNIPCGTATITITPEIYTNNTGNKTSYTATYQPPTGPPVTYYTIAHIAVQISWNEQGIAFPMNEYFAEDIIVNDPMLN